jgi:D-3-phosphoglycerate dehydrogenase
MGRLLAGICSGMPAGIELTYQGKIAEYDTRILTLSVLKGLLGAGSEEPVTYVNAPQLAEERGVGVHETKTTISQDYVNLITVRSGCGHSLAGTLAGVRSEARLVMVDDHDVEVPPARHLLVVRNDDRPGMIGALGVTLAKHQVNIADMALGRARGGGSALMVVATDQAVPEAATAELRAVPGITAVDAVDEL